MNSNNAIKLGQTTISFDDLKVSKAIYLFITILFGVIVIGIIWTAFFRIDEVIKANSIIRPSETISSVSVSAQGKVLNKYYTHNKLVKEGDILLEVDVSTQRLVLDNLRTLKTEYENNLDDMLMFKYYMENRQYGSGYISEQTELMVNAWISEYTRLRLNVDQVIKDKEIQKSMPDFIQIPKNIADLEAEVLRQDTYLTTWTNNQLLQTDNQIKQYSKEIKTREEQIAEYEQNIAYAELKAPISGFIDELVPLNIGDVVFLGENIVRIIPNNSSNIKVEIRIKATDIARLKVGQKVSLVFPGLPPSDFGKLGASISLIPVDISQELIEDEIPVFLVQAELERPYLIADNGEMVQLHSGMIAYSHIIVHQDTILRTILHKLEYIDVI